MDLRSLGIRASQGLDPSKLQLLTCECSYYHYLCDGEDDRVSGSSRSLALVGQREAVSRDAILSLLVQPHA